MAAGMLLRIRGDAKGAIKALKSVSGGTGELTKREKGLLAALTAVTVLVGRAMKQAINYGDMLEKTAQKVGVSTASLSAYALSAELAGTTQQGLISGLQRLQKNMGAALRSPTSAAALAFKNLGVEFQNADGSFRDVEELLPEMSDAMKDMADGTLKTQIAMDLMGRQGAELIPLLNLGGDAVRDLREESEILGIVWSENDADAAAAFNDATVRLGKTWDGFIQTATRAYLPMLVDIAEGAVLAARAINGQTRAERARQREMEKGRKGFEKRQVQAVEDIRNLKHMKERLEDHGWAMRENFDPTVADAWGSTFIEIEEGSREALDQATQRFIAIAQKAGVADKSLDAHKLSWREMVEVVKGVSDDELDRALKHKINVMNDVREAIGEDLGILTKKGRRLLEEAEARRGRGGQVPVGPGGGGPSDAEKAEAAAVRDQEAALSGLYEMYTRIREETRGIDRDTVALGLDAEQAIKHRAAEAVEVLERRLYDAAQTIKNAGPGAEAAYAQVENAINNQIAAVEHQKDEEIRIYREKEKAKAEIEAKSGKKREMTAEERTSAQIQGARDGLSNFQDIAEGITDIVVAAYGESSKEAMAAQKALFVVTKAVGIANAVVNTAVAITNALAVPPTPLGIALAVIAGIAGAVQIAAIVATSIAGVGDAGLPPGALKAAGLNQHSLIAMRNDEMLLDPVGTTHISNMLEAQSRRMNGGGVSSVRTVVEIDGRVLGEVVDNHLVRSAERGDAYSGRIRYGERG